MENGSAGGGDSARLHRPSLSRRLCCFCPGTAPSSCDFLKYLVAVVVLTCQLSTTYISAQLQTTYHFAKPFLLLYGHTSFLVLCLPLQYLVHRRALTQRTLTAVPDTVAPAAADSPVRGITTPSQLRVAAAAASNGGEFGLLQSVDISSPDAPPPIARAARHQLSDDSSPAAFDDTTSTFPPHSFTAYITQSTGVASVAALVRLSVPFTFLWMIANYMFLRALKIGDPASCLALEQLATVFIFLLSVWYLKEIVTAPKVGAVLICTVGVICQAFGDEKAESASVADGASPLLADIFILISTLAVAVYMVSYKRYLKHVTSSGVFVWLGLIGLNCAVLYWPVLLVLDATGVESFAASGDGSSDGAAITGLFIAGNFASFGFNYGLSYGVSIATPLFFRLVTVCAVPLGFIISAIIESLTPPDDEQKASRSATVTALRVSGAMLICAGFMWFAIATERASLLTSAAGAASGDARRDRQLLPVRTRQHSGSINTHSNSSDTASDSAAPSTAALATQIGADASEAESTEALPPVIDNSL